MIDIAIPNNSNMRKKEPEKPEKYQGLKEKIYIIFRLFLQIFSYLVWP